MLMSLSGPTVRTDRVMGLKNSYTMEVKTLVKTSKVQAGVKKHKKVPQIVTKHIVQFKNPASSSQALDYLGYKQINISQAWN